MQEPSAARPHIAPVTKALGAPHLVPAAVRHLRLEQWVTPHQALAQLLLLGNPRDLERLGAVAVRQVDRHLRGASALCRHIQLAPCLAA